MIFNTFLKSALKLREVDLDDHDGDFCDENLITPLEFYSDANSLGLIVKRTISNG